MGRSVSLPQSYDGVQYDGTNLDEVRALLRDPMSRVAMVDSAARLWTDMRVGSVPLNLGDWVLIDEQGLTRHVTG